MTEEELLRLDYGHYYPVKICSRCKEAILRVSNGTCDIIVIDSSKLNLTEEVVERIRKHSGKHIIFAI